MGKHIIILISFLLAITGYSAKAQLNKPNPDATEDSTIGIKPTLKIENLSPAGHCNNQELTFFAPWADHYEISKRRSDTSWIKDYKPVNNWTSETLKPGVTGMIYKRLEEKGAYQFFVKAFKGSRYRVSDTLTRIPCIDNQ